MNEMLPAARLKEVLERVPGASVIIDPDGGRWVAIVRSDSFEGFDEWERQDVVWQLLLDVLTDDEIAKVAFVFTLTFAEAAAFDRAAGE